MTEFSLNKSIYDDSFEVDAEMEEYGTGRLTECMRLYMQWSELVHDEP